MILYQLQLGERMKLHSFCSNFTCCIIDVPALHFWSGYVKS